VHNISIALEPIGGQALIPLLVERSGPATVPHEGEQSGAPMGALAVTPPKPALYRNSRASKDARSFFDRRIFRRDSVARQQVCQIGTFLTKSADGSQGYYRKPSWS
jgi:hypothetical protein